MQPVGHGTINNSEARLSGGSNEIAFHVPYSLKSSAAGGHAQHGLRFINSQAGPAIPPNPGQVVPGPSADAVDPYAATVAAAAAYQHHQQQLQAQQQVKQQAAQQQQQQQMFRQQQVDRQTQLAYLSQQVQAHAQMRYLSQQPFQFDPSFYAPYLGALASSSQYTGQPIRYGSPFNAFAAAQSAAAALLPSGLLNAVTSSPVLGVKSAVSGPLSMRHPNSSNGPRRRPPPRSTIPGVTPNMAGTRPAPKKTRNRRSTNRQWELLDESALPAVSSPSEEDDEEYHDEFVPESSSDADEGVYSEDSDYRGEIGRRRRQLSSTVPARSRGRPKGRKRDLNAIIRKRNDSSDSSYYGVSPRKRRRQPLEPTTTRRSLRATSAGNYAETSPTTYGKSLSDSDDPSFDEGKQRKVIPTGPGVDRILGYRHINAPDDEVSIIPLGPLDGSNGPADINSFQYLVKWMRASHLHNSWITFSEAQQKGYLGLRKIENFHRRMEVLRLRRSCLTEDEVEQMDVALELQRQLDADALIAERIICHRIIPRARLCQALSSTPNLSSSQSSGTAAVEDPPGQIDLDDFLPAVWEGAVDDSRNCASEGHVTQYFVKWTNAPYDQATWESLELLVEKGFDSLITEYDRRRSRVCGPASERAPLNCHALSLTSFEPYQNTPSFLAAGHNGRELRDYQLTGLNWMVSRMKKGLSVLLADEMGLGKTVQTISVLGHLLFAELITGPYLIIVPQSTADNWLSELKTWLPQCNVVVFHGNAMARQIIRNLEMGRVRSRPYMGPPPDAPVGAPGLRVARGGGRRSRYQFDVIIATPSILNSPEDLEFLRSIDWYLMAIDEAHLLKNRDSKRFRELDQFRTRYRLLLSGTPLHNNLQEMWSLLHFLCPEQYSDSAAFRQRFAEVEKPESVGDLKQKQLTDLREELSQLVLRRVKKDVEKSLPRKVERILRVEVSPVQAGCSEAIIARNYEVLAKSSGSSKASLQNVCMELKKVCNHPLLLRSDSEIAEAQRGPGRSDFYQELLQSSGKLTLLDKLLSYLKSRGHRVLIFSQMVRMLNILSMYLSFRGYAHQRLDGTMPRQLRKKAMDMFNDPQSQDFCFLLSTKAGGLGINLTSADTVVIYDSDWNPQNDLQAEARAHRIGQTKTVQIYRLVTKNSIEERILERAKAKMVLDALVVQGLNKPGARGSEEGTLEDNSPTERFASLQNARTTAFSKDELNAILRFGAAQLWGGRNANNADGNREQAPQPEVDLESILAEAETRQEQEEQGLAGQLLSSYTNISDFRYEVPNEIENAKFWETAVPVEDRIRYGAVKRATTEESGSSIMRKRVRRPVDRGDNDKPTAPTHLDEPGPAAGRGPKKRSRGKRRKGGLSNVDDDDYDDEDAQQAQEGLSDSANSDDSAYVYNRRRKKKKLGKRKSQTQSSPTILQRNNGDHKRSNSTKKNDGSSRQPRKKKTDRANDELTTNLTSSTQKVGQTTPVLRVPRKQWKNGETAAISAKIDSNNSAYSEMAESDLSTVDMKIPLHTIRKISLSSFNVRINQSDNVAEESLFDDDSCEGDGPCSERDDETRHDPSRNDDSHQNSERTGDENDEMFEMKIPKRRNGSEQPFREMQQNVPLPMPPIAFPPPPPPPLDDHRVISEEGELASEEGELV